MNFAVEHRILLITNSPSEQLGEVFQKTTTHPIQVLRPDGDIDSAITRIATVIVDAEIGIHEGTRIVTLIKTTHPPMPVIWYQGEAEYANGFGRWKPDKIIKEKIRKENWDRDIARLLREEFCPQPIIDAVHLVAPRVLETTFETSSSVRQIFVKSSRNTLQPITALLPLTGDIVSGRVLVSTNIELLTILHERLFPELEDPGIAELEDIAVGS